MGLVLLAEVEWAFMPSPANGGRCRIIVADDFPVWRATLRSLLSRPGWRVVGEARDGQGAVSKASQLQPDVIVLDIGLPGMNGIEAARLIRQRCPHTTIIFLSQQTDREIIGAALAVGGSSCVFKADALRDLPSAIAAALQATSMPDPS
jgi:DNA-binding NarL/FixJ family response regulator